MKSWKQYWVYCISGGVPRRSLVVSIVVGSILNLINQGDALLGGEPVNMVKIALTYIVPYVVATYGAVSYRINLARIEARTGTGGDKAVAAMTWIEDIVKGEKRR